MVLYPFSGLLGVLPLAAGAILGFHAVLAMSQEKMAEKFHQTTLPQEISALDIHKPNYDKIQSILKKLEDSQLMGHEELDKIYESYLSERAGQTH